MTSTPKITLYTKDHCPYCKRAKALLRSKGASFTDIEITHDPVMTAEMETRSGRKTVPQIFIGDVHVGGGDDLAKLDASGGLMMLLQGLVPA